MIEEDIARKVDSLRSEVLIEEQLYTLKRNILDSYAGICGSMMDKGMLANFDRLVSGPGSGSDIAVWGIGKLGSYLDTVFMNSILARRSDLLNTYLPANNMGGAHPSDNVALALTLAEWRKMDGKTFLSTIHTAFYLSQAFATYYNPEIARYDHDATAIFYTALTIGQALGLSVEQLVLVQRIAGMFGLNMNQAGVGEETDWKHCTYASCALRGFEAVKLAIAGFEAPADIYEGEAAVNCFFPHAERFFEPPPDLNRIIFKRWPALVFCQTPIDVALDLAERIHDKSSITSVVVKTYDIAYRNGALTSAYQPTSRAGRTHSIPYCVATALLKPIEYQDFNELHASNEELKQLIAKVKVVNDPAVQASYPDLARCVIEVRLADGTSLHAVRDVPRGDPREPLSDKELEEKFETYFFFAKEKSEVREIIDRIWALEQQSDLDWLVAPLKRRLI